MHIRRLTILLTRLMIEMKYLSLQKILIVALSLLFVGSVISVIHLKFSFDFEQFFPQGDDDLEFFRSFSKDFESDDNFMLLAVKNAPTVFDSAFLKKFNALTAKASSTPFVVDAQSLTNLTLPLKTPFGLVGVPALHIDDPETYAADKDKILHDERFVRNLISEDASSLVIFLKTKEKLNLPESETLMSSLDSLTRSYGFQEYHFLGRANFQKELIAMEKREVAVSTGAAAILVALIIWLIFRRFWSVFIALTSIGISMLFFFGLLGAVGRELSAMAALYPVLIVIIGTSDVIHMLSKYIDELKHVGDRRKAMILTVKEIGLATFMTAITTAIGFATMTSRIAPITDFGLNAAVGVMVAYVSVLALTAALLPFFEVDQLIRLRKGTTVFDRFMEWIYSVTKRRARLIGAVACVILLISAVGIRRIGTNYNIANNMPDGVKVSEDFKFFEKVFSGFRPLDFAVFAKGGRKANDYDVLKQIDKVETHLHSLPSIRSVNSITLLYKSAHQLNNGNGSEAYKMAGDRESFEADSLLMRKAPKQSLQVLLSKDKEKARIATRILDLGADSVRAAGDRIDQWILGNTDTTVATFRRTGTGFIIDKNVVYLRGDLLQGLFWEVGIIALLMGVMLQNFRMVIIFLIPNLFPLAFAGALIGFMGVQLDAGIALIFTVVFGIAIDDTIHFLSSFKLHQRKGEHVDKALHSTLIETGKPVVISTIILFFGFLVMIFSIHPPSRTVGKLIAVTLVTALMSDLFINPILLRLWIKDKKKGVEIKKEEAPVLMEANH